MREIIKLASGIMAIGFTTAFALTGDNRWGIWAIIMSLNFYL